MSGEKGGKSKQRVLLSYLFPRWSPSYKVEDEMMLLLLHTGERSEWMVSQTRFVTENSYHHCVSPPDPETECPIFFTPPILSSSIMIMIIHPHQSSIPSVDLHPCSPSLHQTHPHTCILCLIKQQKYTDVMMNGLRLMILLGSLDHNRPSTAWSSYKPSKQNHPLLSYHKTMQSIYTQVQVSSSSSSMLS